MPNDIEFSGERKRVRCNEGLDAREPFGSTRWILEPRARKPEPRERRTPPYSTPLRPDAADLSDQKRASRRA